VSSELIFYVVHLRNKLLRNIWRTEHAQKSRTLVSLVLTAISRIDEADHLIKV